MSELVREAKKNPDIRSQAERLTRYLPQKHRWAEIEAIFDFVQNCIRYVGDITNCETLIAPAELLANGSGDCDDKAMLLSALLESIGYSTRLVAIGLKKGEYCHVYVDVQFGRGNQWLALDATEPRPMGWRPVGNFAMIRNN